MSNIGKVGNTYFVNSGVHVYTFSVGAGVNPVGKRLTGISFDKNPDNIGGYRTVPYGENNDHPQEFAKIVYENNLTPKVLTKQAMLMWGQGPALYEERFEKGKRMRFYDEHSDIQKFLNDFDYEDYLHKHTIEFKFINGGFTKYRRNTGFRIGNKAYISELEHISALKARLEWPDASGITKRIITADFHKASYGNILAFPVFDKYNPFGPRISMNYSSLYSYAMDGEYSLPDYFGTREWIRLASSIATLLLNFNENSAAIKYHITSPAIYWDQKEEKLKQKCIEENIEYDDSMLENLKIETFKKFTEALTDVKNVGKFLTTEQVFDDQAQQYIGWKIDVLDQKVKDYIDAQINISKRASLEVTTGLGLHPALSNISNDGNLPSGSEQLYAFKLYLNTDVDMPEMIVCKDLNNAIQANFPGTKVKLGFYHDVILTEEATKPNERTKNK